jgi:outer membrane protein insertion porin family
MICSAKRGLLSAIKRRGTSACVAAVVISIGAALPAPARAAALQEPTRIVGVEIAGNTTIHDTAILQHVRTHPSREVNPQQIREDKRKLYNTRWFSSVEHDYRNTSAGPVLVFHVRERPIVRRVTYAGRRRIKRNLLDSWTGLQVGSPMDPSANREAARQIKRRYEEKGFRFAEVTLEKGGEIGDQEVVFRINEGPKVFVYKRDVTGNKFVSAALLKTKLGTKAAIVGLPILSFGLYNPETIPNDVEKLEAYYHALGYFDAKVTAEPKFSKDKAWVTVQYNVTEGQRYKTRNVVYEGNGALSEKQLLKGRELKPGDYFNARFMNKDVSNMLTQYDEKGHYFAQVQPVPRFLEQPGLVDLVYEIDEDKVRILRNINVHLTNEHSNTKETVVLDHSPMAPGDIVSRTRLRRLEGRLRSSGIFEQGPGGVRVAVTPGEQARGLASHTRPSSVMRAQSADRPTGFGHSVGYGQKTLSGANQPVSSLYFNPPAYFQKPVQAKTLFRGQASSPAFHGHTAPVFRGQIPGGDIRGQNFDPANPIYDNNPQGDPFGRALTAPDPGFVDIDVFANEGRTGRLTFGGGLNSDAGLVGSFVYDEANFDLFRPPTSWADVIDGRAWRGGGQRLRLEAVPGDQVSRYSASWTDPYFLYSDYSLSLSGFFFNRFFPDWDERRGGGRIAIGKQISPELSISGAIRLEEVRINGASGTPVPPDVLQEAIGSSFLSTFRGSVTHDTRNSSAQPSEGHYAQLSYEQAFGDFDYPRFEAEYRQFQTVFSRPDGSGQHVFSVTGQLGWSGDDTPIFERFYAGGFQSFRGFAFRGVGPVENSVSTGGTWMAVGSAEYRFPLVASDAIQGVVFTDFGTVENDVSFDAFRLTVGAGLRVTIPQMGSVPLAFDFGFPVLSEEFDDERIFSFYVSANR